MFTANITKKDFRLGTLQIVVEFSNGVPQETISQAFNITSQEDLDSKIETKIAELNALAALASAVKTGAWVKVVKPKEEPVLTPLQEAEAELYRLKNLIDLGVVKETDQEFVDAVTAYKTAANAK